MELQIRPYTADDIKAMVRIWNEVVEAGDAFPQVAPLTEQNADEFFSAQTATMVADVNGIIFGMYILHPNGIGRCAHIANASFAVASASRGLGLGRKLVENCIETCGKKGFRGLQFNAVVASNEAAQHLYESMGFTKVGMIPASAATRTCSFTTSTRLTPPSPAEDSRLQPVWPLRACFIREHLVITEAKACQSRRFALS